MLQPLVLCLNTWLSRAGAVHGGCRTVINQLSSSQIRAFPPELKIAFHFCLPTKAMTSKFHFDISYLEKKVMETM